MYGMNLCDGERALFVSRDRAQQAVYRVRFVASKTCTVRAVMRKHRRAILGYVVVLEGPEGPHVITEGDVERFRL